MWNQIGPKAKLLIILAALIAVVLLFIFFPYLRLAVLFGGLVFWAMIKGKRRAASDSNKGKGVKAPLRKGRLRGLSTFTPSFSQQRKMVWRGLEINCLSRAVAGGLESFS